MSSYLVETEAPAIWIPRSAATQQGFHDWAKSEEFPEGIQISSNGSDLVIEVQPLKRILRIPVSALATLEGFRDWATSDEFPERVRISFIDQELFVDMSPEELNKHNSVKVEISSVVHRFVRRNHLGRFFGDGTLVTNRSAGLSTEPDGTFASWATLKSGLLRFVARKDRPDETIELEGTPDWVLEILSRSSRTKDAKRLRQNYHRAGIPEYWLVNALGDEIDFQLLSHRADGYVAAVERNGWYHSTVFDCDVRLVRTRDQMGFWGYTLKMAKHKK